MAAAWHLHPGLIAEAYPQASVTGFDYHDASIRAGAQGRRRRRGRRPRHLRGCLRCRFPGFRLRPGRHVRLPARHGRPARRRRATSARALADDGTWLLVDPYAGDYPGGQHEPGRARVLQLLDVRVRTARRFPRARVPVRSATRPARRPPRAHRRTGWVHPVPPGGRDTFQSRFRGQTVGRHGAMTEASVNPAAPVLGVAGMFRMDGRSGWSPAPPPAGAGLPACCTLPGRSW